METPDQIFDAASTAEDTAYKSWQETPDDADKKTSYETAQTARRTAYAVYRDDVTAKLTPPKAPDKYELSIPKDSLLDPSTIERISADAKAKGLSNEAAQELLNREHEVTSSIHQGFEQQIKDTQARWLKEAETDKEIGPELKKNVELAKRFINHVMGEETSNFAKYLNESGLGDHPEAIRFMVRAIKKLGLSEDTFVHAKSQGSGEKSMADKMYGPGTVVGSGVVTNQ